MAINMSDVTIDQSDRQSLLGQSISGDGFGGAVANSQTVRNGFLGLHRSQQATGATLAGVTPEFAQAFQTKSDEYCQRVYAEIAKLENVSTNEAFRGTAVSQALSTFIDSVKSVATAYLRKLVAAENQIANSVAQAYSTQDADLSGQLTADSGSLESQGPRI